MIVGLDARPALFGRTGFARVVTQTLRALAERPGLTVRGFGAAWRAPLPGVELPGVVHRRFPARLQQALAPFGFGVETLLGPLDVYHHTDLVHAPVRRTPEVLNVYDLVFLRDASWHAPGFRAGVEPRLRTRAAAARAVIVPARRIADEVLAAGVATAARTTVVALGVDHVEGLEQPGDAARVARVLAGAGLGAAVIEKLVVVPGTREPRKNQAAVLDAFQALADPRAALLFVGPEGWCCEALEARLAPRARPARVGVAGLVEDADLFALYRHAAVVAYPSFAEGFGLPVFEALRCGTPVLTATGTPMADLAGDAVLAVDPHDGRAVRVGLGRLLGDDILAAELAAAGPPTVAPLTWSATAAALEAVYRAAAAP